MYRRIPARAGAFFSRGSEGEKRERERDARLSLSFAMRGRGGRSPSLFFLPRYILLSSAILLLANAMRFVMRPRADRVRQTSLRYHCIILLPPPRASRRYYPYARLLKIFRELHMSHSRRNLIEKTFPILNFYAWISAYYKMFLLAARFNFIFIFIRLECIFFMLNLSKLNFEEINN